MLLKRHIGLRVKAAREGATLTQAALAEAVDRAVETISNIERGRALPGLDLLDTISNATGVTIAFFVEDYDAGRVRHLTSARVVLEERVRTSLRSLPDKELAMALRIVSAIKD